MIEFLMAFRSLRKAVKARTVLVAVTNEEILRNAMGYAFEVGNGALLFEEVRLSPNNPFTASNWRDNIIKGSELG